MFCSHTVLTLFAFIFSRITTGRLGNMWTMKLRIGPNSRTISRRPSTFRPFGVEDEVDVSVFREQFLNALNDDLDTGTAIEALREISAAILEAPEDEDVREAQDTLQELSAILGLTLAD